jgi:hypothetical protein
MRDLLRDIKKAGVEQWLSEEVECEFEQDLAVPELLIPIVLKPLSSGYLSKDLALGPQARRLLSHRLFSL